MPVSIHHKTNLWLVSTYIFSAGSTTAPFPLMAKELENNAVRVTTDYILHVMQLILHLQIAPKISSQNSCCFQMQKLTLWNMNQTGFSVPLKKLQWPTKNNTRISENVHKEFSVKMVPRQMMNSFFMSAIATSLGLRVDGLLHVFFLFFYLTYQLLTILTFS